MMCSIVGMADVARTKWVGSATFSARMSARYCAVCSSPSACQSTPSLRARIENRVVDVGDVLDVDDLAVGCSQRSARTSVSNWTNVNA